MRTLERMAIALGVVIVGITAVYRYMLGDEQKAALQEGADVLRAATREISDSITPLMSDGPTRSEEEAAARANQERTAAQWEALGY
ncbi:MAG: hypothetical protein Q4A07_06095 [Coriobacteriales bacterium]|nr:hypothetical protein [Coriobacteriales bacterium]